MTITNIISSHNSGTRRSRKIPKRSFCRKMQNRLIFMTICITSNFGNGGILFKRLSIFIIRNLFRIRLMLKYYKSSNNILNKMDIIDCRWLLGLCWSKRYDLIILVLVDVYIVSYLPFFLIWSIIIFHTLSYGEETKQKKQQNNPKY